jgi:hypothetical protein
MFSPIKFGLDFAVGGGVGFVAGAFTPAIGRKIKALFVKDSASLKVDLAKAEAKVKVVQSEVDAKVAQEAAAVAKKV